MSPKWLNAKHHPSPLDFGKTRPKYPVTPGFTYHKVKYRPSSLSLKGRHRPSNSLFTVSWLATEIKKSVLLKLASRKDNHFIFCRRDLPLNVFPPAKVSTVTSLLLSVEWSTVQNHLAGSLIFRSVVLSQLQSVEIQPVSLIVCFYSFIVCY